MLLTSSIVCLPLSRDHSLSCHSTQPPTSYAGKILAVEPTIKVNFARATSALTRPPNDKVPRSATFLTRTLTLRHLHFMLTAKFALHLAHAGTFSLDF